MNASPAEFADEWLSAWNAHDLERILSHYATDIVFVSPVAEALTGCGTVTGIAALRDYWRIGLARAPELHFTLEDLLTGSGTLTILYRNHRRQRVAETFEFASNGKVIRSIACYTEAA